MNNQETLTIHQYISEVRISLILKLQNNHVSIQEIDETIQNNKNYIKDCYNWGFTTHHVVHELTCGNL